jgi:hypothetical protein
LSLGGKLIRLGSELRRPPRFGPVIEFPPPNHRQDEENKDADPGNVSPTARGCLFGAIRRHSPG